MILSPIISGLLGPQAVKLLQKFVVFWGCAVPSRVGYLMFGVPENRPFVLIWDIFDMIVMVIKKVEEILEMVKGFVKKAKEMLRVMLVLLSPLLVYPQTCCVFVLL